MVFVKVFVTFILGIEVSKKMLIQENTQSSKLKKMKMPVEVKRKKKLMMVLNTLVSMLVLEITVS